MDERAEEETKSSMPSAGSTAAGGQSESCNGVPTRDPESSPPHKSRRMNKKSRGDDGRGRRPRKGEAKRARKEKALAQAAHMCQYYVDDTGLRRVRPYIYEFQTHAKERWLGRAVIDVFSAEFGGSPRSYYESAIRCGLLTVNGKMISPDYKLQNSDLVCNRTHRHEPPVAGGDIAIVSESPDEVAVDKPCTVPIHPCGSYRFNTLFYILQRQRPDLSLRICHRLDRLTSGLTILAKTAERAGVIQKQIGTGETRKTYIARVAGNFGEKLASDRRQPGSSEKAAELGASEHASPESGEGNIVPAVPDIDGSTTVRDEGETSTVSRVELTGKPLANVDKPGELWWRYEHGTEGEATVESSSGSAALTGATTDGIKFEETAKGGAISRGGVAGNGVDSGSEAGRGLTDGDRRVGEARVRVNCPIRVLNPKDGVYECHAEGKEAQTVVRKIAYDAASDTSVVECMPVHGRTHQIRLHLEWIGHPIANDPCYGGELHFGNPEAKLRAEEHPTQGWKGTSRSKAAGAAAAVAAAALATETHATERASKLPHGPSSDASGVEERNVVGDVVAATGKTDSLISESEQGPDGVMGGKGEVTQRTPGESGSDAVMEAQREGEDDEAFMIRTCSLCNGGERFNETQLHCVGIWLHALRYQGPDWSFETKMPAWATL